MSQPDIVRAWKDLRYRNHIDAGQQALLPEHPAGSIELHDEELDSAVGGTSLYSCIDSCDVMCISPYCVITVPTLVALGTLPEIQ